METECKLSIQRLALDNDCCIIRNIGQTKINLVTSNNLYFLFMAIDDQIEDEKLKYDIKRQASKISAL